jgi:hypothetical protein
LLRNFNVLDRETHAQLSVGPASDAERAPSWQIPDWEYSPDQMCVLILSAQYLVDWPTLSAESEAERLRFVGDCSTLLNGTDPFRLLDPKEGRIALVGS